MLAFLARWPDRRHPPRVAWIEILRIPRNSQSSAVATLHGWRGLKFNQMAQDVQQIERRHPPRVAWIEIRPDLPPAQPQEGRHPPRVAWIEMARRLRPR